MLRRKTTPHRSPSVSLDMDADPRGLGVRATLNVMVFESEDAARSALEPVRTAPRPPSMQVEGADVYEVLAHF